MPQVGLSCLLSRVVASGNVSVFVVFLGLPGFPRFSLLSVVLSESVGCRRCIATLWRCRCRRRRRRQHHCCRWWMQRMHACSVGASSVAPSIYHFLFRCCLPLPPPPPFSLFPFCRAGHLSGYEAVMQICWPTFRAVSSSKVAQKHRMRAREREKGG